MALPDNKPVIVSAIGGASGYAGLNTPALIAESLDSLALPAEFIRPGDSVVLKPNWVKEHDERRTKPLRYLAAVDGIVGGESNGPMAPDAKPCGVIIAGTHPLTV